MMRNYLMEVFYWFLTGTLAQLDDIP